MQTMALFLVLTSPVTFFGGIIGLWPLLFVAPLQAIAAFALLLSEPNA
jgi:hypothetical protein